MKRTILCLGVLFSMMLMMAGALADHTDTAENVQETTEKAKAKHPERDARYAEANAALKEARTNMGNAESARERIACLEAVIDTYPDYPLRADLFYLIGINSQILRQYDKAVSAYESALSAEPDIADETPIVSYLRAAKHQTFADGTAMVLIVLLVAALLPALIRLSRKDSSTLPWGRIIGAFAAIGIFWIAVILLLPILSGRPAIGLENYPKPILLNFRVGQLGDDTLRALIGYGLAAILAALPIVAATSLLKKSTFRNVLAVAGVLVVSLTIMGLFGIRHCYGRCQYDTKSGRLLFLIKDIGSKKDVPDEMLSLYDESFRKRILAARDKTGE